jgi:hypothetical protein
LPPPRSEAFPKPSNLNLATQPASVSRDENLGKLFACEPSSDEVSLNRIITFPQPTPIVFGDQIALAARDAGSSCDTAIPRSSGLARADVRHPSSDPSIAQGRKSSRIAFSEIDQTRAYPAAEMLQSPAERTPAYTAAFAQRAVGKKAAPADDHRHALP